MEKAKMTLGKSIKDEQMDIESYLSSGSTKTKEPPRNETFNLKLSQEEKAKLDVIWKDKGFRSKQQFVQSLILPALDGV